MKIFYLILFLILTTIVQAQDLRYPSGSINMPGSGSQQTFQINGATDAIEYVLIAPEAATITKLMFGYEGRVGTPVQQKIGIQGVNASTGRCDGTYKTGTGECSVSYTPPANGTWDNTGQEVTLTGTTCAVARGERICIRISPVGTPDGSNLSGYIRSTSNTNESDASEYHFTIDAGSATMRGELPVIGFGNASRWFGYPSSSYTQEYFSSDTSPDEVALKFQYPCASGQTFKIAGADAIVKVPASSTSLKVILYTGTTVLQDVTLDSDNFRSTGSVAGIKAFFDETTLSTLTCGTTYYLALQAQSTSMNMFIPEFIVSSAAHMDAYAWGANTHLATRVDAGSWTATTTRRPAIWPILDKLDAVSSGGKTQATSKLMDGGM